MGDLQPGEHSEADLRRSFVRAVIADLAALQRMLEERVIESGVRRIGVEQEMFLVDRGGGPAPLAMEVLETLDDPRFTTELARFNLEANLPPYRLGGDCLRRLHKDLDNVLSMARAAAAVNGAEVLLTGILPTLQPRDLTLENMTPKERYFALNDAMVRLRGSDFHVHIKGIDEFFMAADNVMLEACNTSFQIHFQAGPENFVGLYNLAQAITGPVLAAAVNSPVLQGHRLWHETRMALFQSSVDHRSDTHQQRGGRPRVQFGDSWLKDSVLEIFREDLARFRVLLAGEIDEDPIAVLERGGLPNLSALRLHNGTVYRWNRPCYGIHEGRAQLRIENRVLPSGPTVVDEVANAAFFFGLLVALSREFDDIAQVMDFDDAKHNFVAGARLGLRAHFAWIGGKVTSASELILGDLLPIAREGLSEAAIDSGDIDQYLGVIEDRVRSGRTGAQWMLDSLQEMPEAVSPYERCRSVTVAALARSQEGGPVHRWPLARVEEGPDWQHGYRTVGQFMTRDLFTAQPDDVIDLAANVMQWKHIRHVPVEDHEGRLVGILSPRDLVRMLAHGQMTGAVIAVREVMRRENLFTVSPDTPTLEALELTVELRHRKHVDARSEGLEGVRQELAHPGLGGQPHRALVVGEHRVDAVAAHAVGLGEALHFARGVDTHHPLSQGSPEQLAIALAHAVHRDVGHHRAKRAALTAKDAAIAGADPERAVQGGDGHDLLGRQLSDRLDLALAQPGQAAAAGADPQGVAIGVQGEDVVAREPVRLGEGGELLAVPARQAAAVGAHPQCVIVDQYAPDNPLTETVVTGQGTHHLAALERGHPALAGQPQRVAVGGDAAHRFVQQAVLHAKGAHVDAVVAGKPAWRAEVEEVSLVLVDREHLRGGQPRIETVDLEVVHLAERTALERQEGDERQQRRRERQATAPAPAIPPLVH